MQCLAGVDPVTRPAALGLGMKDVKMAPIVEVLKYMEGLTPEHGISTHLAPQVRAALVRRADR